MAAKYYDGFSTPIKVQKNTSKSIDYDAYINEMLSKALEYSNKTSTKLSQKEFEKYALKNIPLLAVKDLDFDDLYVDYVSQFGKTQTQLDIANLQNAFAELGIGAPEQLNENGLNTNYQNYLDQLNALSDSQYAVAMDELQRSENDMYRAIGMSQRQMERDIAKRRQQALKSGMSTAQLAAQEQQNLLAAQTGATMLAQQYNDQRYSMINQFATARQQNLTDVLGQQINYSNTRQQNWDSTLANMYAQIYAADKYQK